MNFWFRYHYHPDHQLLVGVIPKVSSPTVSWTICIPGSSQNWLYFFCRENLNTFKYCIVWCFLLCLLGLQNSTDFSNSQNIVWTFCLFWFPLLCCVGTRVTFPPHWIKSLHPALVIPRILWIGCCDLNPVSFCIWENQIHFSGISISSKSDLMDTICLKNPWGFFGVCYRIVICINGHKPLLFLLCLLLFLSHDQFHTLHPAQFCYALFFSFPVNLLPMILGYLKL